MPLRAERRNLILRHLSPLVLILCLVVGIYLPSLDGKFISWDDTVSILDNPGIKDLSWKGILRTLSWTPVERLPGLIYYEYLPIRNLSFMMDYAVWKDSPFGYHVTNIVLHCLNGLFLWIICLSIGVERTVMSWGVLLFLLHPINVESVAWISARKDVLYLFFLLVSFLFYIYYHKNGRTIFFPLSLLCALFSLFSKVSGLLLPLVLALYHWFFLRKTSLFSAAKSLFPFFLVSWGSYFLIYLGKLIGESVPIDTPTSLELLLAPVGIMTSLTKLFLPIHLSAIYDMVDIFPFSIVCGSFFLIFFFLTNLENRRRGALFFLFWIVLQFPVFIRIGPSGPLMMADRYLYAASIGFSFSLMYTMTSISRGWTAIPLTAAIVLCFASLTVERIPVWKDSLSLWQDTVAKSPLNPTAHNNLGAEYERENLLQRAEEEYMQALGSRTYSKNDFSAILSLRNLGALHIRQKKYSLALQELEKAVSLYPDFSEAHRFLGALYLRVYHDREKGTFHLKRSLEISPQQFGSGLLRKPP